MPRLVVKRVRAPTVSRDYGGFPPEVNVHFGKFLNTPVFQVSFPDLDPNDLQELSKYVFSTGYVTTQLNYPQHLSNFLMALADCMRAASQKQINGGI